MLCCTSYSDFPWNPAAVSSSTFSEKSGTPVLYFTLMHNLEFPCNPVSSSGDDTFSEMFPILCTIVGYIAACVSEQPFQ